jgi:hypothetical protein
MTSQQVVDYIRRGIASRLSLSKICERIMDRCVARDSDLTGVGCDNMTITIVGILNGRTREEWYDWIGAQATPFTEADDEELLRPPRNESGGGAATDLPAYNTAAAALEMQLVMSAMRNIAGEELRVSLPGYVSELRNDENEGTASATNDAHQPQTIVLESPRSETSVDSPMSTTAVNNEADKTATNEAQSTEARSSKDESVAAAPANKPNEASTATTKQ